MLRIVVTAPDPDGQDSEGGGPAEIVARALRDAGHEVVWTGPLPTPEQVVTTALQEDVDLVGLPGASPTVLRRVAALLAEQGADDIEVVGGVPAELLGRVAEHDADGTPSP